jgi:hypothetical protein
VGSARRRGRRGHCFGHLQSYRARVALASARPCPGAGELNTYGLANNGGSIDRMFVVCEIALLLGTAGLVWGLDGYLARAAPGNALARWLAGSPDPAKHPAGS